MELDVMLMVIILLAAYCGSIACLMILLKEELFKFFQEEEEGLIGLLPIMAVLGLQMPLESIAPYIYVLVSWTTAICLVLKDLNGK